MIGLVSAMASNILDRTREIGILRSIGARRRDLRAMFRAEGLVIGVLGWLIGIPAGYVLARFILYVFERRFDAAFRFQFPLWTIAVALVVTLVMTVIVMRFPLRRAVRLAPARPSLRVAGGYANAARRWDWDFGRSRFGTNGPDGLRPQPTDCSRDGVREHHHELIGAH